LLGRPWADVLEDPTSGNLVAGVLKGLRLRAVERCPPELIHELARAITAVEGTTPIVIYDYLHAGARRGGAPDIRAAVAALSGELRTWAREACSTALLVAAVSRA